MMEQSHSCKAHSHSSLIGCFYNLIISYRTTRLCYILNTRLICSFYIISEWEECIWTDCYISIACKPFLLFLCCKYRWFLCEYSLPVIENIFILITYIKVNCIISVSTAYTILKWKIKDLWILAQIPVICLLSCKSCTMDSWLLSCSDTNCLSILYIAYSCLLYTSDAADEL